jgi:adenosylmethionine-8-amino-7-oxononanoate aminotransferase
MGAVRGAEFVIERGDDVWVFDPDGRRYLDATASLWYALVGHGRPEIAAAVAAQLRRIESYSAFGDLATVPTLELAEALAARAPMPARVFLTSGGGDSVDTAAKLARRYWYELGQPERTVLLSRTQGYHGTHGIGAERVAAFFIEPVIGAGGVHTPVAGYIEGAADLCARHGVLLVADAVICGFGRLGNWFGIERWDVKPDMIIFAKGVTSGYLPLGGVIVADHVAEPFWQAPDGPVFRHGPTYAGHATCSAAALANIELLERDGLLQRGRELEQALVAVLRGLADHPAAGEVRGGVGTLAAIDLDPELIARDPTAPGRVMIGARKAGVLVRPIGAGIAVSPPLTATLEHFELIGQGVAAGLDAVSSG